MIIINKNSREYLKLLLSTNITGAYNSYLNRDKKALKMGRIFILSLLTTWLIIGWIGILYNSITFIVDLCKYKKDMENYNNSLDCQKDKSVFIYKKYVAIFGWLNLEDLYLGNYKIISKLRTFTPLVVIACINIIYCVTLVELVLFGSEDGILLWGLIICLWVLFPIAIVVAFSIYSLPLVLLINIVTSIEKYVKLKKIDDISNLPGM